MVHVGRVNGHCQWCGRDECTLPNGKSLTFRCVDLTRVQTEERAEIVKWLRETGRYDNPWHLGDAADAIEKGEHLK